MVKRLLFFTLALFFFQVSEAFSQITIGTVDAGPYGSGSTITVPINFPNNQSEFNIGNVFTLYISDAAGNFSGNGTQIGTYTGFYTPFINGSLAGLAPGTGYKLRIVASNPNQTIDVPGTLDIRNVTANPITITPSLQSRNLGIDNLGWCPAEAVNGQSMMVKSNATNPSTVVINLKNLKTGTSINFNELIGTGVDLTGINLGSYLVTVTSTTNIGGVNIKSVRSYFLHNSPLLVNIQDSGQNMGCINGPGQTARVSFELGLTGGIDNNYPGTIYRVDWGDGTTSESTLYEIVNNSSRISHEYNRSSCGEPDIPGNPPILNSFKATINAISQICNFSRPATAYAQVFTNPIARITPGISIGCINTVIRFTNASIGGTRANCSPIMDYTWYVDGVKVKETSNTDPLDYIFTTKGPHTVKLVASNGVGVCLPSEATATICIQEPPQPAFDIIGATTGCAPFIVKVQDKSIIDPSCTPPTNHTYNWVVTNANGVRFTNFINGVPNPTFNLTEPGVYTIALEINSGSCGIFRTVSPDPIIIINGPAVATLSSDKKLCNLGVYKFDDTPNTPTTTIISGTQVTLSDTYTWTVTDINDVPLSASDYIFVDNTGPNSKYPAINFLRNILYKITLTHKNTCTPLGVTDSQILEFFAAPQINAGSDISICYTQNSVQLNATNTGIIRNQRWVGGLGTFSDRTNPNATYIPTATERNDGLVLLNFTADTDLEDPCSTVSDQIRITIKEEILITSSPLKSICTNDKVNYAPTSNIANTSYTWTATGSASASGYADSSIPGVFIADQLSNSDPINNATVTYVITPNNDGCPGVSFTLIVTVTPKPILTATPTASTICSGKSSAITLSTTNTPATTRYTWTSSTTNGVSGNSQNSILAPASAINDILTNTGTSQGTVTYVITPYSSTGCPGEPVNVTINVDPEVTQATTGTDLGICNATTYTLNGNPPKSNETGTWELTSGQTGVSFSDNHLPDAVAIGLVAGQAYTFRWTISAPGACEATTSSVTITVFPPTIAGTIDGATTVCAVSNSGTINLTGNIGNVIRWEKSIDGGAVWQPIANTTTALNYNGLTTTTSYRAVVQNPGCEEKTTNITVITVTPADTQANAGLPQTICGGTTVKLDGNIVKPNNQETGLWTVAPGYPTANFVDATDPKTEVQNLVAGQTYRFTWTITGSSACGPSSSNVDIKLLPVIDKNTISSTSTLVCSGQQIQLTGSTPIGGDGTYHYLWETSIDAGATWTTEGGDTPNLDFTITVPTLFRRTVTSGSCSHTSPAFNVDALPPIGNNIISANQAVCTNEIPIALTGTPPQGGGGSFNYEWELSVDGGTTWSSTNTFQSDFQPRALTRTTQYRRVVSTTTCNGAQKSTSNIIIITLKPDAIAKFTFTKDKGCAPFEITASNVIAEDHPNENATYSWYALTNTETTTIGTGVTFPGYTITNSNEQVIIKLVVTPKIGCNPAEFTWTFSTNQAVPASFTLSETTICGPKLVAFNNTSPQGAGATFKWKVGNTQISTNANPPAHTFQPDPTGKDTTYTVTLYSETICGSDSAKANVLVKAKPRAIFSPGKTVGCSPLPVVFTNNSPNQSGVEYFYDYGDGTNSGWVSNRNDINHTYLATTKIETYHVKMTAKGECGTDVSRIYDIVVSPKTVSAELVVSGTQKMGCAPFKVDFDNNSTGATQYMIDFKDGFGLRSLAASPKTFQYEFKEGGVYDVMLIAKNDCSADTTYEKIIVHAQPKPMFEADVTLGCPNLPVTFKNTTQGNDITSYLWDFGDGSTFLGFEPPIHIFSGDKEYYTVSLTATNTLGCPKTQTLIIHVVPPPQVAFHVNPSTLISIPDYTFNFKDESTNNPTIWHWDFGDGITSELKNPSHTYLDTGTYNVTLRVENQQGCFTTTSKKVTIKGVPGYLFVPNSFVPGSTQPELREFRAKGSGIQTWRFSVFNKWGQILWETTNLTEGRPTEGWDGTFKGQALPQGVYYWKIDVQMVNGSEWKGMTYDKSAPKRTGAIHLIR
ncbi:PKD domain-containing protein [Pedobacter nyackensis]|uniref:PKD domain-containing protein n=1 Tax=Pedobacter nyackensis TaxID=475255 RepID=UPI00292DD075|nr:PKD domain-containing protein [Pedobacter nyackensis]